MEAERQGKPLDHRRQVILRPAAAADAATFGNFDLGDSSAPDLTEVADIVRELWPWSQDASAREFDRQVHVAEQHGAIIDVVRITCSSASRAV